MPRGGARKGSGRPRSAKEETKVVRLPLSVVKAMEKSQQTYYKLPLYLSKVSAGFPSPAEDYLAQQLDLNEHLIKHPAATFFVRASGTSMINAGIHENDILVVDRSLTPVPGKIVIAAIDGQLTIKRLQKKPDGKYILIPDNPEYEPIEISEDSETYIWGVVTTVIHAV